MAFADTYIGSWAVYRLQRNGLESVRTINVPTQPLARSVGPVPVLVKAPEK
jgi:hypothetical protein